LEGKVEEKGEIDATAEDKWLRRHL